MSHSDARIDKFVEPPNVVPLIEEKGIPTLVYIHLKDLRIAGVQWGSLKEAQVSDVINVNTILELISNPKVESWIKRMSGKKIPDEILSEYILETQSGRLLNTVLTQSGHQIVSVKVNKVQLDPLSEIVEEFHFQNPVLAQYLGARSWADFMAGKGKFSPGTLVPRNFNIDAQLQPYPK